MSLEKSFVDQVALLAGPEDPTSVGTTATISLPANSEILDTSLIAPRGKVLATKSITPEIKPEFDWNNDNLCEEYLSSNQEQGINTVFADVIVPEIPDQEIEIEVPVIHIQEEPEVKPEPKMSLDQVWSGDSMFDEEMIPVNPYEVHRDSPEAAPQVEEAMEDELDLLKLVMDDTIQPDDPEFIEFTKTEETPEDLETIDLGALIGPSTSSQALPTVLEVKEEPLDLEDPDWTAEEPPKKRGRGRPRLPRPYPEPPK